ncbi:MAG: hypothetical protein OEZ02_05915 [Anaerolineae bacterium]|nr:hypothetical protein [Anaerolineae bacterium]
MTNLTGTRIKQYILCAALMVLATPIPVKAQEDLEVKFSVKAGLDGYCRSNSTLPVHITMENSGPDVDGKLEVHVDRVISDTTYHVQQISLPSSSRKSITIYPHIINSSRNVYVSATFGRKEYPQITTRITCLDEDDRLIGVLANQPTGMNLLSSSAPASGRTYIAQWDMKMMPDRGAGLQALDIMIISDMDTGLLNAQQVEALGEWLSQGGTLIVTGGSGWKKTTAGIGELLPFSPSGSKTITIPDDLGEFSGSIRPPRGTMVAATGRLKDGGEALLTRDGTALVTSRDYGFGKVFFLAFDPMDGGFRGWVGMGVFYKALLSQGAFPPAWSGGIIQTRLAENAASAISSLRMPSGILLCGLLGFYTVIVGPLNLLFLKRKKKSELAWLTIPGMIIIFTVIILMTGGYLRGNQVIMKRLAIVQVWDDVPQAQVNGVVSVFSPSRERFDIEVGGGLMPYSLTFGSHSSSVEINATGQTSLMENVLIDTGGMKIFGIEGSVPASGMSHDLHLEIEDRGVRLRGEVTNTSGLTLNDAVLIYPSGEKKLGQLTPNETIKVDLTIPRSLFFGDQSSYWSTKNTVLAEAVSGISGRPQDADEYVRVNLWDSVIPQRTADIVRGDSIYITGWVSEPWLPVELDSRFDHEDSTLYIYSIRPNTDSVAGGAIFFPDDFTWELVETDMEEDEVTPYDLDLYGKLAEFHFSLKQPSAITQVNSLILHVLPFESIGKNDVPGAVIYLWDFTLGNWTKMNVTEWGNYIVPYPAKYVGEFGEIRLLLRSKMHPSIETRHFRKIDFTLIVGSGR